VQLVPTRPNVELRGGDVVFAFPYDAAIVDAMRAMPGRRFDWEAKEWRVPADDAAAPYVRDVLARWPQLVAADEVEAWLGDARSGWVARVTARRREGGPAFVARLLAGEVPEGLREGAEPILDGRTVVLPFTGAVGEALLEDDGVRLDAGATACAQRLQVGLDPPPARLVVEHSVAEPRFAIEPLWDHDVVGAFDRLPGVDTRNHALPIDGWALEPLEHLVRRFAVEVAASALPHLEHLRLDHDEAVAAIRRSRAREAEPLDPLPRISGGELAPFQWAGVRYVLDARKTFLADEQGLGKTVQALAALEADDAFPAVVVCPASLKLNWEREAERWLPHRTRNVVSGRGTVPVSAEITIVNYEVVADHTASLLRARPRALVLDESHWCKNPRAKRTRAVARLSKALAPEALRVALTGTPVMNRPDELVPQLRIIGRLEEFGSGAQFARRFRGQDVEERLHWHLRRTCFVRRLKKDVLPQLPAKRQVVVPMALTNEAEYRLAERDVIAWLREQPLDLRSLNAKVAAALRAERLAQLSTLKQLAARGKLAAAASWVHDFLESGEALVLFSHHQDVQEALLERFPDALHLLGKDSMARRDEAVRAFQEGEGPQLLIASTLVAGQGITLTRASNVAFLELEWTPALHDQAEDRLHRIGQHDAVTAWYLLAAGTIDEAIADLLQRKRGIVNAVTEGRRDAADAGLVEGVARALREGPRRHLRPVA
jgi:hypothetical protein